MTNLPSFEEARVVRADGGCKCSCGREYRDHPMFHEPTFHALCDGTIVKL